MATVHHRNGSQTDAMPPGDNLRRLRLMSAWVELSYGNWSAGAVTVFGFFALKIPDRFAARVRWAAADAPGIFEVAQCHTDRSVGNLSKVPTKRLREKEFGILDRLRRPPSPACRTGPTSRRPDGT